MRTAVFVVVLLIINTATGYAQNYRTIRAGSEMYFVNEADEGFDVRIDSIAILGTDTLLFNYRHIREKPGSPGCYTARGASWLGDRVLITPDGQNIYFNKNGDSIRINTLAGKGSSWTMYSYKDGRTIRARVDSWHDTLAFGRPDSVKHIDLDIMGSDGSAVLKQRFMQLNLSRQFGFLTTTNFYVFPDLQALLETQEETPRYLYLRGLSNPALGIQNITPWTLFDYEVGDELHEESNLISSTGSVLSQSIKKIEGKKTNGDTIIYSLREINKRITATYGSGLKIDTTFYTSTSTLTTYDHFLADLNLLSHEPQIEGGPYVTQPSWFIPGKRCKTPHDYFTSAGDDCYSIVMDLLGREYIEGVGGPYFDDYFSTFDRHYLIPVYYKKGNETWGRPFDFATSISPSVKESKIHIYPNPASATLFVEAGDRSINAVHILDLYGRQVLPSAKIITGNSIDISQLSPGIYFLRLSMDGNTLIHKFIKE